MDYYKILGINEESSQEEIDLAYKDLLNIFDPSVNSSKYSFYKYRLVKKAYKNLKTKKDRDLYNLQRKIENENKKDIVKINEGSNVLLSDFENQTYKEKELIDIKTLNFKEEYIKSDLDIKKEVSILNFLFEKEIEIIYFYNEEKNEEEKETCDLCFGEGKYIYENNIVPCYKCKKRGYTFKKNKLAKSKKTIIKKSLKKNSNKEEFFFYNKNDDILLKIGVFPFKEEVSIKENEININFNIDKDKYLNGFSIIDTKENSFFIDPFVKNKKVLKFNIGEYKINYKITHSFNYPLKIIEKLKKYESSYYKKEILVPNFFNLLGGKYLDIFNLGLKRNIWFKACKKKNKLIIFKRNKNDKIKFSKYFLPKIFFIIDLALIISIFSLFFYNISGMILMVLTIFIYINIFLYFSKKKV